MQHSPHPFVCFSGVCGSGSGARRYRVTMLPPSEQPSPSSSDGKQSSVGANGILQTTTTTARVQMPRSRSCVSVLAEAECSAQSRNNGSADSSVSTAITAPGQWPVDDEVSDCLTKFFNDLLIDLQVWGQGAGLCTGDLVPFRDGSKKGRRGPDWTCLGLDTAFTTLRMQGRRIAIGMRWMAHCNVRLHHTLGRPLLVSRAQRDRSPLETLTVTEPVSMPVYKLLAAVLICRCSHYTGNPAELCFNGCGARPDGSGEDGGAAS